MTSAETIKVTIFNQTYILRSASGAEHVRELASLVDERMRQIASHLTVHDVPKIAILVALNIADEMQSLKARYESEMEQLLKRSSGEKEDAGNAQLPESARASWFDDIFEADMPAKDRAQRLSTQISAKLQSLRKNEPQEPNIEGVEE